MHRWLYRTNCRGLLVTRSAVRRPLGSSFGGSREFPPVDLVERRYRVSRPTEKRLAEASSYFLRGCRREQLDPSPLFERLFAVFHETEFLQLVELPGDRVPVAVEGGGDRFCGRLSLLHEVDTDVYPVWETPNTCGNNIVSSGSSAVSTSIGSIPSVQHW